MRKLSILFVLILASEFAVAQTSNNPGEVFIRQATFDHNDAVKKFTGDFVTLFGSEMDFDAFDQYDTEGNVAIVNQFGDNNNSTLIQNGIGNMARMNIFGNRNTTGLAQNGNDNLFILNLKGNDSIINSAQNGVNNLMRLNLIGSFPNQIFSQKGNGHTIELFDAGNGGGVPMQIEQRGNGASVIIENY